MNGCCGSGDHTAAADSVPAGNKGVQQSKACLLTLAPPLSPARKAAHTYTNAAERLLQDARASAMDSTKPSRPGLSGWNTRFRPSLSAA
jgi:hypothetical protein